jgi:transcription initiation factor TFIID subunit 12
LLPKRGSKSGTNANSHGSSNATTFEQLNPAIRARVNVTQFIFPPAMTEGQPNSKTWLREAKARFGRMSQCLEMAQNRKQELQQNLQAKLQVGVVALEEMNTFNQKIQQYPKSHPESYNFMTKFREQQQSFRQQQAQRRFANQG